MRKPLRAAGAIYLALLAASFLVRRGGHPDPVPEPDETFARVAAVDGNRILARTIRLAYRHADPSEDSRAPYVVLLHGSPGSRKDFETVVPALATRYRVLVPDLPGFGDSERDVPDYSIRAHARYVFELLDTLDVHEAHVVGFSMGGGVALSMAEIAPRRVRSITLLSSIGVQEMELLGNYHLNRALHAAQLAGVWSLRELIPHFGALDRTILGVPYARNFFDTDQRPLRDILERFDAPMLILHGQRDPLVPVQAAREHARIVPQAEVAITPESHFMVFREGPELAVQIEAFLDRVERGEAPTRATADPTRRERAAAPFDPRSLPPLTGFPWLLLLVILAGSTFVSEDLACIGAGLLVASGRLGFPPAAAACLTGIFAGDLSLFMTGRLLGRAVVSRAPMKWFLTEHQLQRSSQWFRERGPAVIVASRFLPGSRLPTYVAAGVLHTPFWRFALWFGVAALLWTPLLVGLSALFGAPILDAFRAFEMWAIPGAVLAMVVLLVGLRLVPKLFTWRGRRLLAASWRRLTRWEYWPPYVFYPPVVLYVLWLGIRHRGVTLFTAANPGIEAGGFINESKASILRGLAGAGDAIARWRLLPATDTLASRVDTVRRFVADEGLDLPIVLKPDAGQRGSGVAIPRTWPEIETHLRDARYDVIAQEYLPGVELGVFYVRRPSETRGRIFAITSKALPAVLGDGRRTLEQLILSDRRARAMAKVYFEKQENRLHEIVAKGVSVQLVELGTHCRGAYFHDGAELLTPELESAIDRVSRTFDGFYFGRYDVRAPSVEDLRAGSFRVIELNGVTSEATSIYDPRHGLFDAYRTLRAQWRWAFEIGAANRERGAVPTGIVGLARSIVRYRASAGGHV